MYKKVGTITSAIGLIFLGIWMIISRNDSLLADKILKWWYVLFILLGIELIYFYGIRKTTEKMGFNGLFIFVVLIFFAIDIFKGVFYNYPDLFSYKFNKNFDSYNYWDDSKYKSSDFTSEFDSSKEIYINTDNAKITVKKSDNNKVKFTGKIYYDDDIKRDKYDVKVNDNNDTKEININESEIEGVKADLYIPDGCKLKFKSDNIELESSDNNLKVDYDIDSDNGMIKIKNDSESVKTNINNGLVNIDNKMTKDINISLDNGMVTLNTENKDLSLDINADRGLCKCNDSTSVNSGIKKDFGNGLNKLKISVDNGSITTKVAGTFEE